MKCFVILTVLVFASKHENDAESVAANLEEKIMENVVENSIVMKNEEDEYDNKKRKSSEYIGVSYHERDKRWTARRWSKLEKKLFKNGTYRDEETAAHASDTLARELMANDEQVHKLNFPDDSTEVHPEKRTKTSKYFGVYYDENKKKWCAQRWSKPEKKIFTNGYYKDEETAAHASDTLARKLKTNGEQNHKLNFPDDSIEVNAKKKAKTSKFIGVHYIEKHEKWIAQRWSKIEKKSLAREYADQETAAHASDTLARKLMVNGEHGHKLNFPDDDTDVRPEERIKSSKYFGVHYDEKTKKWVARRWSKTEKKVICNGAYHKNEETAAHASDTLAKKLMANGEQNHKLNFPHDSTEEQPEQQNNKRKRPFDLEYSQTNEDNFEK